MNPFALTNLIDLRFHLHQIRVNQAYWREAVIEELQREQDNCNALCRFAFEELGVNEHEILTNLESFRKWALSIDSIRDIDRWEHELRSKQEREILSKYVVGPNSELTELQNKLETDIRALFDKCKKSAVQTEKRDRRDKHDAIENGFGFDNWGFYRSQLGWFLYEKGYHKNSQISWFSVPKNVSLEIDSFFK